MGRIGGARGEVPRLQGFAAVAAQGCTQRLAVYAVPEFAQPDLQAVGAIATLMLSNTSTITASQPGSTLVCGRAGARSHQA
jgi:hypothetical protein